ncbi:alpha/beta hydrolase family protein [Luteimonas salinilitoris]|uniref:Alpha/beta hydrolase family protein n=1 Tax=Luteimonas salinilitoris TaxID=3237697 RepID=A0ABV4HS07_9GAMM
MSMFSALGLALASLLVPGVSHGEAFACPAGGTRDAVVTLETRLAGVPALLRVPPTITGPPVLLWHGFGPPASERALMEMLPLDDVAALKVYLGLPLFGARAPAPGELARRQAEDLASEVFEPVVMAAAEELPAVLGALQRIGCMRPDDRIGLFGFSAGGAAVLFALAERDVPVAGAVVLNASTGLGTSVAAYERTTGKSYPWNDRARALAQRSDAVKRADAIAAGDPPPALRIVQGTADAMLTPEPALALQQALAPRYGAHAGQRLHLELVEGMPHNVTDADTVAGLRASVVDWFNRFLDAADVQDGA